MDIVKDPDVFVLTFLSDFLADWECHHLIEQIDKHARPATLETGPDDYRVASSADLNQIRCATARRTEMRLAKAIGIPENLCEGLQGQRYQAGEYYKEHNDAFHEGTPEFERHIPERGQRTWTAMIYLNYVEGGGGTFFPKPGVAIVPHPGMAVVWYNLNGERRPNPMALHYAGPVESGSKYIVTAWFRERS